MYDTFPAVRFLTNLIDADFFSRACVCGALRWIDGHDRLRRWPLTSKTARLLHERCHLTEREFFAGLSEHINCKQNTVASTGATQMDTVAMMINYLFLILLINHVTTSEPAIMFVALILPYFWLKYVPQGPVSWSPCAVLKLEFLTNECICCLH